VALLHHCVVTLSPSTSCDDELVKEATVVRTFRDSREAVVEAQAAEDAAQMLRDGYVVASRTWSRARVGVLQGLFAIGPSWLLPRGTASLTVTYERATWTPDDQPV
jgi:hypothetical protein